MQKKLKVAVLFGGRSGEHEVSLMSARSVLKALNPDRYDVVRVGITHEGVWLVGEDVLESFETEKFDHLTTVTLLPDPTRRGIHALQVRDGSEYFEHYADIDIFIPILHGTFGEDGTLQGLFEMASVAYVGAGVLGASVGMDKGIFKDVMRANDIPVVDGLILLRSDIAGDFEKSLDRVELVAPYPLFVKPANMGSSVGVTKCQNRSDLYEGIMEASRFDRRILVERGINAREIELSVLGNDTPQASVPGEIIPAEDFYSYHAKYYNEESQAVIPAPIPFETSKRMRAIAVKAYQAIDCAGMARVDFLLDKDSGEFYLNEVNTIPGFTQISMYPKLWGATGLPYTELIDRLIDLALERRKDRDQTEWKYEN